MLAFFDTENHRVVLMKVDGSTAQLGDIFSDEPETLAIMPDEKLCPRHRERPRLHRISHGDPRDRQETTESGGERNVAHYNNISAEVAVYATSSGAQVWKEHVVRHQGGLLKLSARASRRSRD
jgi:hypothetical protein